MRLHPDPLVNAHARDAGAALARRNALPSLVKWAVMGVCGVEQGAYPNPAWTAQDAQALAEGEAARKLAFALLPWWRRLFGGVRAVPLR